MLSEVVSIPVMHVVVIPGTWMSDADAAGGCPTACRVYNSLLETIGWVDNSHVDVRFVPLPGETWKERAEGAVVALEQMFPEGVPPLVAIAWSAGAIVARHMNAIFRERHKRDLFVVAGFFAGAARTGVTYRDFFHLLRTLPWQILKGYLTGAFRWSPQAIAETMFGCQVEEIPSEWQGTGMMDPALQRHEGRWLVSSMFFPGLKELLAPPPLPCPIFPLLGEHDVYVGPETRYLAENIISPEVLKGAFHGALLEPSRWEDEFRLWSERIAGTYFRAVAPIKKTY